MSGLDRSLQDRVEALLGEPVVAATRATGGYSPAQRWLLDVGGERVFAKVGVPPVAAENLRHEASVLQRLQLRCMPGVVAWEDHATHPILVLEDLSSSSWPPPWTSTSVDRTLEAVREMHGSGGELSTYDERHGPEAGWWQRVQLDPAAFLALGVVSPDWVRKHLPTLIAAEGSVNPRGTAVTHFDLRSDNICVSERGARIIDWSHACLGNPILDLGLFLPGLVAEGGPDPEQVMPGEPGVAAWVTGFFAVHAGKPYIPAAPNVRAMQARHLIHAIPWVERALGL